jgi:signal recognition particle subunit SEC65
MLDGFTNVTITKDLTKDIRKSLENLARKTVCVGIPDSVEHPDSKITNAQLLYIHTNGVRDKEMIREMQHDLNTMPYSKAHELYVHENGSPLWKSPPRPVLAPAIDANKEQIGELMKDTAVDALEGKDISPALNQVGMQGQNIARAWFTDPRNDWEENKQSTIKKKGSDRPLIDTGELRKAITYVIKDGDI